MENATLESVQVRSQMEIVYLSGERKGEVDRFKHDVISFGRSPECDVIFQGAALTVSRVHAKIVKRNQQYFLENLGPNGSFVNGVRVQQALLTSGDVLSFSASGPKVRVLCRTEAGHDLRSYPTPPDMELTVQFAANTQTFRQVRVVLGRGDRADFVLKDSALHDCHAELRVFGQDCYIASLVPDNGVLVNGRFIVDERKLENNDIVRLCKDGPRFVYLGDGRLMQQEEKQHPGFSAQGNDEMRTYIVPAKPSLLGNLKSALRSKKGDAE